MYKDDDEPTVFEMSPLGARQRLLPSKTFVSRLPAPLPASLQVPAMTSATATPVLILPPEIHYPDAIDEMLSSSSSWSSASASSTMPVALLPIASRRVRWIAVPLMSLLALVALGGAMWQPNESQGPSIAPGIASTDEAVEHPSSSIATTEDPAPIEEAPVAKKLAPIYGAKPTAKRVSNSAKSRKVSVNASTALGNLRPRKAW